MSIKACFTLSYGHGRELSYIADFEIICGDNFQKVITWIFFDKHEILPATLGALCYCVNCLVQDNLHTPPTEGIGNFWGRRGSQRPKEF